ncbi:MAG TPA: hypothetical protein VIL98_06220 [Gaiellaceae bacterium]
MPLKPVAKTGDTTKTPGTLMFTGASTGSWTGAAVTETAYPLLTIGGVGVIHLASCLFSFSGLAANGTTAVTGSSTVTLTASSTTLQKSSTFVLRDGDTTQDSFGNALTVAAANILRSD